MYLMVIRRSGSQEILSEAAFDREFSGQAGYLRCKECAKGRPVHVKSIYDIPLTFEDLAATE